MSNRSSAIEPVRQACFRVAALVISRLRGGDIRAELDRLEALPRARGMLEVGAVLAALLALALSAAALGWWALCLYFVGIILVFR